MDMLPQRYWACCEGLEISILSEIAHVERCRSVGLKQLSIHCTLGTGVLSHYMSKDK